MNAAQDAICQCDQRQKRNQHRGNVEREVQPVDCPFSSGTQHVFGLLSSHFFFTHLQAAHCYGLLSFRHEHFCNQYGPRGGHNDGGEQMLGLNAEGDVGGHRRTADVGHAAGHHGHQFRARELRQEWTDGERRFSATHENAGSNVQ